MKRFFAIFLCISITFSGCKSTIVGKSANSSSGTEANPSQDLASATSSIETRTASQTSDLMSQYKAFAEEFIVDSCEEEFQNYVQDPALRETFPYLPGMYIYNSPSGTLVYLFGTSQAYLADTSWFPEYAQSALKESTCFVTAHPEVNYSDEDLAYAAELMAQEPQETGDGAAAKLVQNIKEYQESRALEGPDATQVRLLYWFLTKHCSLTEKQMNEALWDMAEGKERVLAYTGTDVINRMNNLNLEMDKILITSCVGQIFNSENAIIHDIYSYYYWLSNCFYSRTYIDKWWDDRFFCNGDLDNAETIFELSGIPINETCDGFLCASTHYAEFYDEYYATVFMPNCQDIVNTIESEATDGSVFVAVDLTYIYDIIAALEEDNWVFVDRQPFQK